MDDHIYIIAEAAQGYEGSVELAKLLVQSASKAGANAIKFQVVYAEDLAEPGYEYYELFKTLEMLDDEWLSIRDLAKQNKLDFVVDVFGPRSLALAKTLKVDGIKLHSTTFFDDELSSEVLKFNIPVYISIGGIKIEELEEFIERNRLKKRDNIRILYGYQSEPTPIEKNNLARIAELQKLTNLKIGFMDHADANGCDDINLSIFSLGLGVRLFEKHITLDRVLELEDFVSALSPSRFKNYVGTLNRIFAALGSQSLILNEDEFTYRGKALKSVVAYKTIKKGVALSREVLKLSRPAKARDCFKYSDVVGKVTLREIQKGQAIGSEDLE